MTDRGPLFSLLLLVVWLQSGWVRAAPESSAPVSFAIAAAPAWVRPFSAEPASEENPASGISYLLLDQQENIASAASYYHEVHRITSENGLQNGSAITVSFDPSYQKLAFHSIRLIRKGAATDRLDRSQIKLFQREREMESFLYDGSYTAQCQLEDVRIGDVIDYSYTVEGANPVLRGKYFDTFSTDWDTPVRHAVTRLLYPSRRPLHFALKNRAIQPVITTKGGQHRMALG